MIQKMDCPLKHLLQTIHITFTIRICQVMMKKTVLIQGKIDSPVCPLCITKLFSYTKLSLRGICNTILTSCFMRNPSLLKPYLIRTILLRLFTTVFSQLMLYLKKSEAPILLPLGCYQNPLFLILIMITSQLGLDSCFTKMITCPILGLLILINISMLIFPFGTANGGPNLALMPQKGEA